MKYTVELNKPAQIEIFEQKKDNVVRIYVQVEQGNYITNQSIVRLSLSRDAMIEFGKALICQSLKNDDGDMTHFYPTRPNEGRVISYGLMIHPDSVEPIVGDDDFDPIDSYINNNEKV